VHFNFITYFPYYFPIIFPLFYWILVENKWWKSSGSAPPPPFIPPPNIIDPRTELTMLELAPALEAAEVGKMIEELGD
jgi:hypothetical protein